MRHLAGDANFVVEPRERAFVARCCLGQELEGHGLAEGQIGGAIDFTHTAAAQQARDAVARRQ